MLSFTNNSQEISDAQFYLVTVPTPVNNENKPDMTSLINASSLVGGF